MRRIAILSSLLLCFVIPAYAQVRVGINIGINMPVFPQLVVVPGYPVYYDPYADSNYFFYDGQYWVYADDNWYASDWYNGPWDMVGPEFVPLYVLRVPVRYYRRPPVYFGAWQRNAPPRWGEHWGRDWESRRAGWNHWDHNSRPRPAPLPVYQKKFSGDRYPHAVDQQRALRTQNYHYQPRDPLVKQHENAVRGQQHDSRANDAHTKSPSAPQPSRDVRDHSLPSPSPHPVAPSNAPGNTPGNAPSHAPERNNVHRNEAAQHPAPRPVQAPAEHDATMAPRQQSRPEQPQRPAPNVNRDAGRHENAAPAPRQNRGPAERPAAHPREEPHEHKDDGR